MTRGPSVVLDADVLIPILSCDFLLTCFDLGLFVPIITPKILVEVQQNLLENFPKIDPERLRLRGNQIAATLLLHVQLDRFATDEVLPINVKDRHIAMAAIGEGAGVATNDKRLRRELASLDPPVQAWSADQFAIHLCQQNRRGIKQVLEAMVAKRTRPPIELDYMIDQLEGALPKFVESLRAIN